jgi:hypothetical protein
VVITNKIGMIDNKVIMIKVLIVWSEEPVFESKPLIVFVTSSASNA